MRSEFRDCTQCLCFAVRKAARAVTQHYDNALRPHGLRATQFNLLVVLTQAGPLPMARLADVLGMDRTSLTRNLRPPAKKGWVDFADDPTDRRIKTVAITPKGVAAIRKALPAWRKAQAGAEAIVTRAGFTAMS